VPLGRKPYHERCGTRHWESEPCPMDGAPTKGRGGKPSKGEKEIHKTHAYGNWRPWVCLGDVTGQDTRYRTCLDANCRHQDVENRKCRHGKKPQV